MAVITDDLKHDTKAVNVFTEEVLQKLEEKGYYFRRMIQWSDGCGAQYKCKNAFHDLVRLSATRNMYIERNFFGSRHGKNACDGESAVIKSSAARAVKNRRVIIQSAQDLFAYCKTHLCKPDYVDNKCSHYRRDFIFVSVINRSFSAELKPITGTRSLHAVRAHGTHKLKTRTLSCYCHGCEQGDDCFNSSHVKPWREVQLQMKKKHQNPDCCVLNGAFPDELVSNSEDAEQDVASSSTTDITSSEFMSQFELSACGILNGLSGSTPDGLLDGHAQDVGSSPMTSSEFMSQFETPVLEMLNQALFGVNAANSDSI